MSKCILGSIGPARNKEAALGLVEILLVLGIRLEYGLMKLPFRLLKLLLLLLLLVEMGMVVGMEVGAGFEIGFPVGVELLFMPFKWE